MPHAELYAAAICALTLVSGVFVLRGLRRESYRTWSAPALCAFWALTACFVVMGAIGIVGLAFQGNGLGLGTVVAVLTGSLKIGWPRPAR